MYLKIISRLSASTGFSVAWVCLYITVAFAFNGMLRPFWGDYLVTFNYAFCMLSYAIYWPYMRLRIDLKMTNLFQFVASFAFGVIVFWAGGYFFQINITPDLSNPKNMLVLFLLGPIIDELIFRFGIWHPIYKIVKKHLWVVLLTAALYSFKHYYSIFNVPSSLYPFKYYQTFYTLFLGLWWGFRYVKTNTFISPLALHMMFNAGFYVGFKLLIVQ